MYRTLVRHSIRPLSGIKVLDLTRVLAGPTATMLLADLGANVIKVEEVSRGDDTRSWNPPSAPIIPNAPAPHLPAESAYFLAVNRNKRSMTVNFKHPDGLAILHRLVEQSDVLVENFVSGKLAEMGLGYEDCKKINPRLIYASITGYGQTGPYAKAAGYDVIIEGEAGLMHITGEPDGAPCKVGVAATDISTGLYAHGAIMAGLLSRNQTGQGMWVDCNLFETQVRVYTSSYPDCRFSKHCVQLSHCGERGVPSRNKPSLYCSVSSIPVQRWLHYDWRRQR